MKQDILCLMLAYPEYITNIEEKNGFVYLVMKSGKKLLYDDKTTKNLRKKLSKPRSSRYIRTNLSPYQLLKV